MGAGWLGYDTARVATLLRHLVRTSDELAELAGDEAAATAELGATIGTIVADVRTEWIPMLGRIAADTTLTSWHPVAASGSLVVVTCQPPTGDADTVARWWDGLSEHQRHAVIAANPSAIGSRDGVPAWARDDANRRLLAADLERLAAVESTGALTDEQAAVLANARAIEAALSDGAGFVDARTGTPVTVQLYIYEPAALGGDGRAAISLGDLDTARHIAIAVPGMGTEASRIRTTVPAAVFDSASRHTSAAIAVMTWHGYDAPSLVVVDGSDDRPTDDVADWISEAGDLIEVATVGPATHGAALLAADVSGVRAMRVPGGNDDVVVVHVTVIGNSYGSTTVAIAADEFDLEADDVVLTGSPGAGRAGDASDLTTGRSNTWVGSSSDDPVSYLGRTGGAEPHDVVDVVVGGPGIGLGNDPAEDDFGAQRFQAEWPGRNDEFSSPLARHLHYFDPCGEAQYNIGAIVAAEYDAVRLAEHRHKDESWDVWDPLGDLLPVDPEADEPADAPACPPLPGD